MTISQAAVAAIVTTVILSGMALLLVAAAADRIRRTPGPYETLRGEDR